MDFLRVYSYQSTHSEMMPFSPPLHTQAVEQLREAGGGAHWLSSVRENLVLASEQEASRLRN